MPETGTFLSVDPVESEPPYAYVGGNVVSRIDPSGMAPPPENPCQGGKCRIDNFKIEYYGVYVGETTNIPPHLEPEYWSRQKDHGRASFRRYVRFFFEGLNMEQCFVVQYKKVRIEVQYGYPRFGSVRWEQRRPYGVTVKEWTVDNIYLGEEYDPEKNAEYGNLSRSLDNTKMRLRDAPGVILDRHFNSEFPPIAKYWADFKFMIVVYQRSELPSEKIEFFNELPESKTLPSYVMKVYWDFSGWATKVYPKKGEYEIIERP
jgi:hypothetical protein